MKLLIFDLDGTLVDTGCDITEALNHAIAPMGLGPLETPEVTAMVGEGIPNLIMKALGHKHMHRADKTRERFVVFYKKHLLKHTVPYPTVLDTLVELKKLGYRMAVLSNKNTDMSIEILRGLGMLDYFELVAGGDIVPEKKPHGGAVHYVLDELGVSPADAIMIGDSAYDIEAAHNAGIKAIAVLYGFRDRSTLTEADDMAEEFKDILKIV